MQSEVDSNRRCSQMPTRRQAKHHGIPLLPSLEPVKRSRLVEARGRVLSFLLRQPRVQELPKTAMAARYLSQAKQASGQAEKKA
jgi:hypothetical protein